MKVYRGFVVIDSKLKHVIKDIQADSDEEAQRRIVSALLARRRLSHVHTCMALSDFVHGQRAECPPNASLTVLEQVELAPMGTVVNA